MTPLFADRTPEREPPSRDPFPADATWVENLGSWVLFYVTCRPKAQMPHPSGDQDRSRGASTAHYSCLKRGGRGEGGEVGSRALLGLVDTIWSSFWRSPTTAEGRCRS